MATNHALVELIEKGASPYDLVKFAEGKWGEYTYTGALLDGVCIEEVPDGQLWRINEYDGSESLEIFNPEKWSKA